jgi:BirA family biotin operon repressor/biotin-[acetyl-CoA-carboxylase] ligase
MDTGLKSQLDSLPLAEWRYADTIGSTNDAALAWVEDGAPDLGLVVADQQTLGRGRFQRRWITRPGTALAFSLILRPTAGELTHLTRFSPLGAVAVCQAVHQGLGLTAEIKWPNDILLNGRKASGILVENAWKGSDLLAVVIGIGVNVSPAAIPDPSELMFPATCLETALGRQVDRWKVLHDILESLIAWRPRLASPAFFTTWENLLAYKGQWVTLSGQLGAEQAGELVGLDPDGNLLLRDETGHLTHIIAGDVSLRSAGAV